MVLISEGRNLLFVGEKRSERAKQMQVTWKDGRLAAKQLFDALRAIGVDPANCDFTNVFERGGKAKIKKHKGLIVAMGTKVKNELQKMKIDHLHIIHPAAKGAIRKKETYCAHVADVFKQIV